MSNQAELDHRAAGPEQAESLRESLLYTLQVCEDLLPEDAHPVHREHLKLIANLVRLSFQQSDEGETAASE